MEIKPQADVSSAYEAFSANQGLHRSLAWIFDTPARVMLPAAAAITALIVFVDLLIEENASIGVLFLIPIMLASIHLNRWQVVTAAAICAVIRESCSPFAWESHFQSRLVSVLVSFVAGGLFALEMARNRSLIKSHFLQLREQIRRRLDAEAQLRAIIESSPAAILTLDRNGRVDLANQAADTLFCLQPGQLRGRPVSDYLPMLGDIHLQMTDARPLRTATNCRGHRANGESFLACVWFATLPTESGTRLAAIITDSSEELRDWQHTSLETLLRSTRVLVGSVSHEIRNICAAIAVAHANLGRLSGVAQAEDYEALGMLTQTLSRVAAFELGSSHEAEIGTLSVHHLVEEFRIVVDPLLEAEGVVLTLDMPAALPPVRGERHGLLQVLLNLTRNSIRALKAQPDRRLRLGSESLGGVVMLRLCDNGPGVPAPDRLFQPFQNGADAVGLGLFISRSIVRGFNGELYHEPSREGCTMCIRLEAVPDSETVADFDTSELHV